ncbi:unnamed protein product [Orchesella dallaii]|uniref:Uncharacterized protein n=1 Tax=Orchesella dallaii TaxID=48710 RepID=A0ABP1SA94_9HEXA
MEIILPHLSWLIGYESCFNTIFSLNKITYEPTNQILPLVPHTYYTKLRRPTYPRTVPRLPALFGQWTVCQTISFILQFETNSHKQVSSSLQLGHDFVGFYLTYSCTDFGIFCGITFVLDETIKINNKPVAMFPLYTFYILPFTPETKKNFHLFDFRIASNCPMLQLPYKITYPIRKSGFNNLHQIVLEKHPVEITFMCKFCDPNLGIFLDRHGSKGRYPYQDFTIAFTPDNNHLSLHSSLEKLYIEATGDGKRYTYYKLALPWNIRKLGYHFEPTTWMKIISISKAENTFKVLDLKPTLDEIILSILLEETQAPLIERVEKWTTTNLFPALGAVLNIKYISIIPIESAYYNFITCHWDSPLNLLAYVQPFQWHVWLVLFASIWLTTFTIPFITAHLYSLNNESIRRINHCTIFLTLSFLITETIICAKELYGILRIRPILSLWLLTSIIITNAYKGQLNAKTTAPSKLLKVETFQELSGFNLFSKRKCDPIEIDDGQYCCEFGADLITWLGDKLNKKDFYRIISSTNKIDNITGRLPNIDFIKGYDFKTKTDGKIASLLPQLEILTTNDNDSVVYHAIQHCKRLAYVGKKSEIKTLLRELPFSCRHPMYIGKDKLFEKISAWYIQPSGGNYLIRRFRYLEESGIYYFWKKWVDIDYHPRQRCTTEGFQAMSIHSNSIVIFFMFVFGTVIAASIFLVEFQTNIFQHLID